MKKTIFSAIISLSLLIPGAIFAQQSGPVSSVSGPVPSCPTLSQDLYVSPIDLHVGSVDAASNGKVSVLQNILVLKGYLTMPPGVSTGYFGNLTKKALASYQASLGIYPAVGYFGSITRAKFQSIGCGDTNRNISLSAISPSSGPAQTQVTIFGNGFVSNGNTVNFGGGVIPNISSSNGTSLTFTVPNSLNPGCYYSSPQCLIASQQVVPGNYPVSVTNINGTSNSVNFIVGSSNNNGGPIINGVTAPTTLALNQMGTWTVKATNPVNDQSASPINNQLSYAVDWGESQYCPPNRESPCYFSSAAAAPVSSFQQSASFTHSYSQAGIYTQTFTVSNGVGQAQTKTTVQVDILSTVGGPTLSQLSPNSGPVGMQVTIYGSKFTATGNKINFSGGEYYNLSNLSSSNGTSISFTIPSGTDYACFHTSPQCYIPSQMTQPGDHTISVANINGTSNALKFTITSAN